MTGLLRSASGACRAVALVAGLTGCATNGGAGQLPTAPRSFIMLTALGRGVLALRHGCPRLENPGASVLLVWDKGSRLNLISTPPRITDANGVSHAVGETVYLGGGGVPAERYKGDPKLYGRIMECGGGTVFRTHGYADHLASPSS